MTIASQLLQLSHLSQLLQVSQMGVDFAKIAGRLQFYRLMPYRWLND
ncbi:hypothetical protein ENHAE0001_0299 [Enhydrobacter aerosaccus SK60]|nr:hypothetical protein ENHAE0001_0299 [Enhydrobacter aerosaccus SK60]